MMGEKSGWMERLARIAAEWVAPVATLLLCVYWFFCVLRSLP